MNVNNLRESAVKACEDTHFQSLGSVRYEISNPMFVAIEIEPSFSSGETFSDISPFNYKNPLMWKYKNYYLY